MAEQLGQSESLNLRRAIHPRPRLCNYCHQPLADDDRMYMHVECDEKMQAERSAQRAETRDLEEMPF